MTDNDICFTLSGQPFKRAIKKPVIRKLGTISCSRCEVTPVVFHDKLYRFEYLHSARLLLDASYFQFVDVYSNTVTKPFAFNHHLGCAYTDGAYMYAVGVEERFGEEEPWGGHKVRVFRSADLEKWEEFTALCLPDWGFWNTSVCRKDGIYTIALEIDKPYEECRGDKYAVRFAQSTDMIHWGMTPSECVFMRENLPVGAQSLYTVPDDPHYYILHIEHLPGRFYSTCIARSTDLINWEHSPVNPFMTYNEYEDKKLAHPFFTPEERELIDAAPDTNLSDVEICEFQGRTIIYYNWGDQWDAPIFLGEAVFEGTMKELLQGFFPK